MRGERVWAALAWLLDGPWLTRERAVAWCRVLLALELVMAVAGGVHSYRHADKRTGVAASDFISFYAAGKLANSAHPAAVYNPAQHLAVERRVAGNKFPYLEFYYPPIFLLICAPLARLPYWVAWLVFEGSTLALYVVVMVRILGSRFWPGVVPILGFPALFWNVSFGQNAFLSAALFGAATLLVDRRPVASGFCFGALAFKPHFGLLVPLALLAGRQWRCAAAAVICVTLLAELSTFAFGIGTWRAFASAFLGAPSVYAHGHIKLSYLITVFGAAHALGLPDRAAMAVQAIAAALAASVVFRAWRADLAPPVRNAALLAGTLLAVPIIMYYDLVLTSVVLAWLLRAGRQRGFAPGEKLAVGFVYPAALLTHFPGKVPPGLIGLMATTLLLVWVGARVQRERELSYRGSKPLASPGVRASHVMLGEGRASTSFYRAHREVVDGRPSPTMTAGTNPLGTRANKSVPVNFLATVSRFDGADDGERPESATALGRMPGVVMPPMPQLIVRPTRRHRDA